MWDRVDGVKRAAGKHAAGCGVALSYVLSFGLRSPFSFYRVCFELGRLTIGVLEALPYDYCKARRPWPAREDSSTPQLSHICKPKFGTRSLLQQCDCCELGIS